MFGRLGFLVCICSPRKVGFLMWVCEFFLFSVAVTEDRSLGTSCNKFILAHGSGNPRAWCQCLLDLVA